jgi:hypothetical protein
MEIRITSGTIRMSKQFFAKEALKPGSYLRIIMGMNDSKSIKVKNIVKQDNQVIIKYIYSDRVILEEDFTTFFDEMKKIYGREIHGELFITIHMSFEYENFAYRICFD